MKYAAKHYVKINKVMYTPGEILNEDLGAEKLERLLRLGAVAALHNAGEGFTTGNSGDGNSERGEGRGSLPERAEDEPCDAEHSCEADMRSRDENEDDAEEAEIEEIDAMEGIVPAKPEKKPARKSGRKKA